MLTAFVAAWGVQHLEVVLAIFSALKLKIDSVREWLETLGTTGKNSLKFKFFIYF